MLNLVLFWHYPLNSFSAWDDDYKSGWGQRCKQPPIFTCWAAQGPYWGEQCLSREDGCHCLEKEAVTQTTAFSLKVWNTLTPLKSSDTLVYVYVNPQCSSNSIHLSHSLFSHLTQWWCISWPKFHGNITGKGLCEITYVMMSVEMMSLVLWLCGNFMVFPWQWSSLTFGSMVAKGNKFWSCGCVLWCRRVVEAKMTVSK